MCRPVTVSTVIFYENLRSADERLHFCLLCFQNNKSISLSNCFHSSIMAVVPCLLWRDGRNISTARQVHYRFCHCLFGSTRIDVGTVHSNSAKQRT